MPSISELNALRGRPPRTVITRTSIASAEAFMLPTTWHDGSIDAQAIVEDILVRVVVQKAGATAPTVAALATRSAITGSGTTAEAVAVVAGGETLVGDGPAKRWDLSGLASAGERIWVIHIATGTSGKLELIKRSGSGL